MGLDCGSSIWVQEHINGKLKRRGRSLRNYINRLPQPCGWILWVLIMSAPRRGNIKHWGTEACSGSQLPNINLPLITSMCSQIFLSTVPLPFSPLYLRQTLPVLKDWINALLVHKLTEAHKLISSCQRSSIFPGETSPLQHARRIF